MLPAKNGRGFDTKFGKLTTKRILNVPPAPSDSTTVSPSARDCWSTVVSVKPVVVSSVFALNWIPNTELNIGEDIGFGLGTVVPGAGPGRPASPVPIAT